MSAVIEKVQVRKYPKSIFARCRETEEERNGVEYVDAWNVIGDVDGTPWDIQTRNYERALEYARLMDAGDNDGLQKLFGESTTRG